MNTLIIFVKYPLAGSVKTRLAKDIGNENAVSFYKKCINALVEEHSNAPYDVIYAINSAEHDWSDYIESNQMIVQANGSLTEKLSDVFEKVDSPTIVIGSDLPDLNQDDILQAFESLKKNDCVIGPAKDGGYYLIGMKKYYEVFDGIDWSTEKVFEQTMKQLLEKKAKVVLLETKEDIDTGEEYKRFKEAYPDF
jgi:rSAM/selenodomain-associated transferase 1